MDEVRVFLTPDADARLRRMLDAFEAGLLGPGRDGDDPPRLLPILLGKPTEDVAKGGTGTFEIYSGPKGAETGTGETIEDVYCRSAAITTTQMSYLQPVDTGWEAVPTGCT